MTVQQGMGHRPTSKLRTLPPSALTSATPGTERSAGRITQSSVERGSAAGGRQTSVSGMRSR